MTSTSVGMRCPECAQQKTPIKTAQSAFSGGDPVVTYALIALNVIVALAGFVGGASASGGSIGSSLLNDGSVSRFAIADGDYWRLITAGFLHAGMFHLFFNMFSLWVLGSLLEPAIGRLRFGIIYFVSLLAGSFGALLLEPTRPTVGASGAIFGLMGAAVIVMRRRGMSAMESGLGLWIGLNLLITFTVPSISIGGHVGGLIGGALTAFVLFELPERVKLPRAAVMLLAAAIAGAAVVGAVVVSG